LNTIIYRARGNSKGNVFKAFARAGLFYVRGRENDRGPVLISSSGLSAPPHSMAHSMAHFMATQLAPDRKLANAFGGKIADLVAERGFKAVECSII
jgi:hypothetical protein